ncbi:DNA helicase RecQ [Sandarakinorhabdus cyanobacteriorum]|uniref:DNA helicase RecQ n=1 Tax=Sandarakinorhabdus cyanobacteriorum TaxID=1981098 RepID=A0A255Y8X5_9SPHN|nr:DNA helicase RecQ [Sandarakinorhabdus cyanobacteriorum]OYQ25687.1 DNA helicase RecQ [Sandarakinorhabdus cyanobacteriorum]
MTPRQLLKQVFGHDDFRGDQEAIIADVLAGRDVLTIMPTGAGKSICYQLPALIRPGTGIVISPLIALMEDQVQALKAVGVRAATLNSQSADSGQVWRDMADGQLDLLYVSPERALMEGFGALLSRTEIALIAIDEAHCVSQWGHDFRPEYRRLRSLCDALPGVPRIALTATADRETRADIAVQLGIAPDRITLSGFDRPNIRYEVAGKDNLRRQLLAFLAGQGGQAGIIYAPTRAATETICGWLTEAGLRARPYHAGLDAITRSRHQADFVAAEDMVMVATIAFGMGINKPDVRFVAHAGLPKSIEAYYQETGRAGRDGDPAVAHLIWGGEDVARLRGFIAAGEGSDAHKASETRRMNALIGFLETAACRRHALLRYFGEAPPERCGNCDNCLNPPNLVDATGAARKLLSAVYRTGQRFGIAHLIDVLAGKTNEKVTKFGHDRSSVFGIGCDWPADQWRNLGRQLEAIDALERDPEGGGLVLGPAARAILKGEVPITMKQVAPRRAAARASASADLAASDQPLFERLRALRRQLAAEAGVPPYIVFSDATLRSMAASRPRDMAGMARIPGVGAVKLESWGAVFLAAINGD